MAEKTQTQKDTEKANSRVFRSRGNVRGDDGKTTLTTFSRDSYQHETNQDVFDIEQGGGGGLPEGYEEVLRDYVDADNNANQEYYLTRQP